MLYKPQGAQNERRRAARGAARRVDPRAAAEAAARCLGCYLMRNGMTSRATMLMTLIIGLMAGPAVSL